ncbi:MAG: D-alanyl-D-alanine carboxypeptidase family protein [Parvibaculaceae bacterium]
MSRTHRWGKGAFLAPLLLLALLLLSLPPNDAGAQTQPAFDTTAKYAILMDSRSGKIYFEKNADELMQPASMSKVMTALMVFERLKSGRLHLDDEFTVSVDAWKRGGATSGGSTMYADVNSRVKLRDLMQGVIVQSANDACIVIAEGIAGSEQAFSDLMTQRARELGLAKSTFRNATGLPDPEHLVTARELAMLTRYLIEVFPEYYKIYSQPEFTWNNITQKNRNPLLGSFPGADGVKTGFTSASGYGLIGSAIRDGRRLIVVMNGMKTAAERAREAPKLLDWGFRRFRTVSLYEAGQSVGQARVWGGTQSWTRLTAKSDIRVMLADEERDLASAEIQYETPLIAPVAADREVGKLRIKVDGKLVAETPLFTSEAVEATDNMWHKAFDSLTYMAFGG